MNINLREIITDKLQHLDIVSSIIFLIAGCGLLVYYIVNPSQSFMLMLSSVLIISALVYIYNRNDLKINTINDNLSGRISCRESKIISISYYIIVILATLSLTLVVSNQRPIIFFVLIAISSILLYISIIYYKLKEIFYLVKIFILVFLVNCSTIFFFSGGGTDTWTHLAMNKLLVSSGSILSLYGKEPDFPMSHIAIAISSIVPSISVEIATYLILSINLMLSGLCLYLFTKNLFGYKVGLCACLIYLMSTNIIFWSIFPQTTTYGIIIITYVLYLVQKILLLSKKEIILPYLICIILFMIAIILGHAVSTFALLMILCCLILTVITSKITMKENYNGDNIKGLLLLPIIFGIGTITYWTIAKYDYYLYDASFLDKMGGSIRDFLQSDISSVVISSGSVSPTFDISSVAVYMLDKAGFFICLIFTFISLYILFSKKNHSFFGNFLISVTGVLLFLIYIFPFFGSDLLISGRWYSYLSFFLAITMAISLVTLNKVKLGRVINIIIIGMFVFASITSLSVNMDNPVYQSQESFSRNIYSFSEKESAYTISSITENKIYTDLRYNFLFNDKYVGNYYWMATDKDTLSSDSNYLYPPDDILVIRVTDIDGFVELSRDKPSLLDTNYLKLLSSKHSLIYNIGDVEGYIT